MSHCPAHDDHDPSLSIRDAGDGKILVHCHAGCEQSQVISELRAWGLWVDCGSDRGRLTSPRPREALKRPPAQDLAGWTAVSLRIWQSAGPAPGTLAEAYLRARGIRVSPPQTIRFHPRLKHPTGGMWPGLVALITCGIDDPSLAVHRTFLSCDGTGKAPTDPQKMMLGPCRGGAVRLAVAEQSLMVGEGIETCLAAMHTAGQPAWAALSTSGLRTLELPA